MKILSDFDGVWTDQALEAESVRLWMEAEVSRLSGISPDALQLDFARFEEAIHASPAEHGWAPDGRITAYVDEDPFCMTNALAAHLATARGHRAKAYREGVLAAGFESLTAFADDCFVRGLAAFRRDHPPAIVPHAGRVIAALHDAGAEVVVVSNSPAEKIVCWFRAVDVDAGTEPGHDLRVIGEAGKQFLGVREELVQLGVREVAVDRPRYRQILEREAPDLVIGDVLSLDLALPLVLREQGEACAPARLVLRAHPHTPAWVRALCEDGTIDHLVEDVADLVGLLDSTRLEPR